MTPTDEIHQVIERSSNFTVRLLSREENREDEHTSHRVHATVLRPLLAIAEECWAYGIEKDSEVWRCALGILSPARGRYKVDTAGDPVTGREFFWNAHGGKRGTIVMVVPIAKFRPEETFKECREAWVFDNYRSGHSLAALKYATSKLEARSHIVFCLPRNNGIEWAEVFAPKPLVFELYAQAVAHSSPPLVR